MRTIQLTTDDVMPGSDALEGEFLDARHRARVIRETTTVLKPDGSLLLLYVPNALPRSACEAAFRVFNDVHLRSDNRGMAAGGPRFRPVKKDGTRSRTTQARPVRSGLVGFMDRTPRLPFCRTTDFNLDHHADFEAVRPFAVAASLKFQAWAPERWAAQRSFVDAVPKDFVISGTAFTTLTVNRTFRTAAHRDAGDLKSGLGVMATLEGGHYDGGELIFPRYRTAVDMRTGGLCLADVHELHGNAPMFGRRFVRLSFVFYAREGMRECGTVEEERERAALLRGGLE